MHMFVHLFTAALVRQRLPYQNSLVWIFCANEFISQRVMYMYDSIFSVHIHVLFVQSMTGVYYAEAILCRTVIPCKTSRGEYWLCVRTVRARVIAGNPLYVNACVLHNLPLEYWHI